MDGSESFVLFTDEAAVMCRNIKRLRRPDEPPSDQELRNAALQFVRKISGFNTPSQVNKETFDRAVDDVARASRQLFESLRVRERPRVTSSEELSRA
jgi:hypothetical protein